MFVECIMTLTGSVIMHVTLNLRLCCINKAIEIHQSFVLTNQTEPSCTSVTLLVKCRIQAQPGSSNTTPFKWLYTIPLSYGSVHLADFQCVITTKPGSLLPMFPAGMKMWLQTHSSLMSQHTMMVSLDMEVVLWHRFILVLLAILLRFIPCLLSHKFRHTS